MVAISQAKGPTIQIDYYAFAKGGITSVALMALSIGAMKGIELYTNRSFIPVQRNLYFTALSAIYLIGVARFSGPFTKELQEEEKASKNLSKPSNITGPNDLDLTTIDRNLLNESTLSLLDEIQKGEVKWIEQTIPLYSGKFIKIDFDTSTKERKEEALSLLKACQLDLQDPQSKTTLLPVVLENKERDDDAENFCIVESPPNQGYKAVQYIEKTHGANGSLMRNQFFGALLTEFRRIIEGQGISIQGNLEKMEEQDLLDLSEEDRYLNTMYSALNDQRDSEIHYGNLVIAHRSLIKMHLSSTSSSITANRSISRAFVSARMSPKMQVFQESFVEQFIGKHESKLSLESFPEEFVARNNAVKNAPAEMKMHYGSRWMRQVCGALSREDYFTVNPPNHLETITLKKTNEEPRTVEYIRESTPHISGATIDPTFREYLNLLEKNENGLLYSAHQRLKDQKEGIGYYIQPEVEDPRAQTLIKLEKDHPNFILIFQSVENDLFIKGPMTIDELKTKIIESFTKPSGRNQNRLPHFLQNDKAYEARMGRMLDDIHEVFFNGQTDLNDQKKKESFIMIFYAMQRYDLITGDYKKEFPIGVLTTPCKDFYDRGLGQSIMTRLFNLIQKHGKDIPDEKLEEISNAGQFPPLMGKGLPAIPHRIDPALNAIKEISKLEDLEPFQKLDFHGWKVDDTTVHRSPMQSVVS